MLVKVLASQEGVTISRLHLKHSLLDLQDRNIECTASQVIYSNSANEPVSFPCRRFSFAMCHSVSAANAINLHFILGFVQTISQSSSCGLIDHTKDVQTSNLTSIFGSLKFTKHTDTFKIFNISYKLFKNTNRNVKRSVMIKAKSVLQINTKVNTFFTNLTGVHIIKQVWDDLQEHLTSRNNWNNWIENNWIEYRGSAQEHKTFCLNLSTNRQKDQRGWKWDVPAVCPFTGKLRLAQNCSMLKPGFNKDPFRGQNMLLQTKHGQLKHNRSFPFSPLNVMM